MDDFTGIKLYLNSLVYDQNIFGFSLKVLKYGISLRVFNLKRYITFLLLHFKQALKTIVFLTGLYPVILTE